MRGVRATLLTFAASLATVGLLAVLAAVGFLIGWAAGGVHGGIVGLVAVAGLFAVAYAYCDRMVLAAMSARPVSEVEHPELHRLVRELSSAGRCPVPRLAVSPAEQPNSFVVGRNPRFVTVCCTQGLLRILEESELRGVLGHELAHVSDARLRSASVAASVSAGMAFVITWPSAIGRLMPTAAWRVPSAGSRRVPGRGGLGERDLRQRDLRERDLGGRDLGALEALLMLVLGPLAALIVRIAVPRGGEFRADLGGAMMTGDPVALASALRKIEIEAARMPMMPDGRLASISHLLIAYPFRAEGVARLFLTQAPMGERLRRLEALAGYRRLLRSIALVACFVFGGLGPSLLAVGASGSAVLAVARAVLAVVDELKGEVEILALEQ